MRAVFITGASGFVGTNLVERLCREKITVHAQARSEATARKLQSVGARTFLGDLDDSRSMAEGMTGCDVVFHLAAKLDAWGNWDDFVRVNVVGTKNVIAAAKLAGVKRLVHCSTEAVLVGAPIINADEQQPYSSSIRGFYPMSKALAEQEALKPESQNGLEIVVVRPRLVWGKGDSVLAPRFVEACNRGVFKWIGGGQNETSTANVSNVVEGLVLAALRGRPGNIYFITDGVTMKLKDFLEPILQVYGVDTTKIGTAPLSVMRLAAWTCETAWSWLPLSSDPPLLPFMLDLLFETVTVNDEKARKELGYVPLVDYATGLQEIKASLAKSNARH